MLPQFYRGLILVEPHGQYIKRGTKSIIIKSINLSDISHKPLLLIENKVALGILYLDDPKTITIKEFKKLGKYHQITEEERLDWWKGKEPLYEYKILKKRIFKEPIKINYKQGPQVLVKPENIWLIRPKKYFIGTSGYQYVTWRNSFYPKGLRIIDEFNYYSEKFNTVEINYTFYKIPSLETWTKWYYSAPSNFKFSVKLNRYLVNKNIKSNDKAFNQFMKGLSILKDKLGCILIQYSSRFKNTKSNFSELDNLLKKIRAKDSQVRIALEFRDPSWFVDPVYKLIKIYNGTIAITHINNRGRWTNLPSGFNPSLETFVRTANFIYIRMHGRTGQYTGSYKTRMLRDIINFLEPLNIQNVYIYFNNTDSKTGGMADATTDAKKIISLVNYKNDRL